MVIFVRKPNICTKVNLHDRFVSNAVTVTGKNRVTSGVMSKASDTQMKDTVLVY